MSGKKKRTVYSPEFKAKVGLEAVKGVKTINKERKFDRLLRIIVNRSW